MAKLKRVSCSREDCQCRDHDCSIDRMSMLPDELVLSILSHLSFKEVAATSILSRRWRHVWTFAQSLDFDGTKSLLKLALNRNCPKEMLDEARSDYVRWVNRGIALLHKESTIYEFRVFFNLNSTYKETIDEWIRYALARKVQRLELNLKNDRHVFFPPNTDFYTFPYQLLRKNLNDFKYLTRLSTKYVNVNGEVLEFILGNAPLLEDLSVSHSLELTTLKITGPFPTLKRLEITSCYNISSLEICDVNLVYFIYEGQRIHFLLKNVPLLVNVSIRGTITQHLEYILELLSRYLPKVETLTLDYFETTPWNITNLYNLDVKMSNLKQLVVRAHVFKESSLLPSTDLICILPCLQRFVLEVLHRYPDDASKYVKKIVRPYAQLKEVKFVGYCGFTSDMEFVMDLLENATSLEKIEIDSRLLVFSAYQYAYFHHAAFRDTFSKYEIYGRTHAKEHLTKIVPPNITLNIL